MFCTYIVLKRQQLSASWGGRTEGMQKNHYASSLTEKMELWISIGPQQRQTKYMWLTHDKGEGDTVGKTVLTFEDSLFAIKKG